MITPDQVKPLLLDACPKLHRYSPQHRRGNKDDSTSAGRLLYFDAGEFVRHLDVLKSSGTTDEFDAVFDVIERLLVAGDD